MYSPDDVDLWTSSSGDFAHPDSPVGGAGRGASSASGPIRFNAIGSDDRPHPRAPAARTRVAEKDAGHKLQISGVVVGGGPLDDGTIDQVNKAAKKETNKRYVAYETVVKVGGSLAWRANNPGNLRSASTQIGTVKGGVGKFAVFATMDDGRAAQKDLYVNTYGTWTVKAAVMKLTPPEENDTDAYLAELAKAGVKLDKDVKSQIDVLMKAIEANEGMIPGTEVSRPKK